jgi:hypothetical protein
VRRSTGGRLLYDAVALDMDGTLTKAHIGEQQHGCAWSTLACASPENPYTCENLKNT